VSGLAEMLSSCASPVDLLRHAGLAPTSPVTGCILDAFAAVPPTREQVKIWQQIHPHGLLTKAKWPTEKKRLLVVDKGRRGTGTSGVVAPQAAYEALCVESHDQEAAAGSQVLFVVIAPLLHQAREAARAIKGLLDELACVGVRYEARGEATAPEFIIRAPATRTEKVLTVAVADSVAVRSHALAFVCFDECGFLPSEAWLAQTDKDILAAVSPGQAQFSQARMVYMSSRGAPQGIHHAAVTKCPKDGLLVHCATWVMNPRISKEQCRKYSNDDDVVFRREYAAEIWGWSGERFIDTSRLVVGSEHAGHGPRAGGSYIIAADLGGQIDPHCVGVFSGFEVEVSAETIPVKHVVVEHLEVFAPSRTEPVPIELVAGRINDLSLAYNNAGCVFDPFSAPTLELHLRKLGFSEHQEPPGSKGLDVPAPRTYARRSVANQHQTPRWLLVKSLVEGGRLHLAADHGALKTELAGLTCAQQSNGALRVEAGRGHDDRCDVTALGAECAVRLPPTGGSGGSPEFVNNGFHWRGSGSSLEIVPSEGTGWYRGGRPCAPPEWAEDFGKHALQMLSRGIHTPAIDRWLAKQPLQIQKAYSLNPIEPVRAESIGDPHARSERINARVKF
jgi:hypothetical protein